MGTALRILKYNIHQSARLVFMVEQASERVLQSSLGALADVKQVPDVPKVREVISRAKSSGER